MEDWVTIRNIKSKNPGIGTRTIANMLGISRNTVKKALKGDIHQYNRGIRKINGNVKPFVDFIKESFIKKNLRVSRILNDIRSKGYNGSSYALYAYIRNKLKPIKDDINRAYPSVFKSYNTDPGVQMQYDWAEYVVPIGHNSVKTYIHQNILGFSRYKFYDVSLSVTQNDVFNALSESFSFFDGVCDRIQVDNAKVFVDRAGTIAVWNKRFLHFCGFYGIAPTRSLPAHPWSKGKVEKPFDYLENHFIKGNEFGSFEDLRNRLKQFQNNVNLLMHRTTKEIPSTTFKTKEKEFLKPLPIDKISGKRKRYNGFTEELRKVTKDCLISLKGSRYSVPYHFACQNVWVKILFGATLQIYSYKGELIATHKLSLSKGDLIIDKDHFKGYRNTGRVPISASISRLTSRFANYADINGFISNIKSQKRIDPARHLYRIANLFEYYDDKDCIMAMEECFNLNLFNVNIIKGFITKSSKPKTEQLNLFNIKLPKGDVKRNLLEYRL